MRAVSCVVAAHFSDESNLANYGKSEVVEVPKSVTWEMPGSHKDYHCRASRCGPNFRRLIFREFLVLLAGTFRFLPTKETELARRVVSKLQTYLYNDWINFDDLKEHPDLFQNLMERDIRCRVAAMGYRLNKTLHERPVGFMKPD
jgi:hypothetical protein